MEKIALSREKWLDEALRALAEQGHDALRADPLAKRLKVSRGSFYWHFQDVPSFHAAVLERWRQVAYDRPLKIAGRHGAKQVSDLERLLDLAFTEPPTLERAIRGWATVFRPAAETVALVDRLRTTRLAAMFEQDGTPPERAEASAQVLYWTYIGWIFSASLPVAPATLVEIRARLGSGRATR